MQDWLNDIPPLRVPRKPKVKAVPVVYRHDIRKLYFDARRVMFEREYPTAWAAGEYFDGKIPDITTTNGHQRYMEDIINFTGHHCERVNVMGVPVKQPDSTIKWRRIRYQWPWKARQLFKKHKYPF